MKNLTNLADPAAISSATNNELAVLVGIKDQSISFFDEGIEVNSNSWLDCLSDDIAEMLDISSYAAGGVISSMIKKGYFVTDDECAFLTQKAVDEINSL